MEAGLFFASLLIIHEHSRFCFHVFLHDAPIFERAAPHSGAVAHQERLVAESGAQQAVAGHVGFVARDAGVLVIPTEPDATGRIDLNVAFRLLGDRGLTRLLVEGGGRLAAALLRAGLVDRLVWLHAPLLLGGDGIPAVAKLGLDALADAPRFDRLTNEMVGEDMLTTFRARPG